MFGLQKERECVSSLGALKSFRRYGPSEDCGADGKDGNLANEVYIVVTGTAPSSIFTSLKFTRVPAD